MKYKTKKLIIISTSSNARLAKYYFESDSEYTVAAFTVNREYITNPCFEGLPVVALEDIVSKYPPSEFEAFVAIGYKNMNKLREKLYLKCKDSGYTMANYISSHCSYLSQFPTGDNCFILEDNTIQPFVKIGNNVVLWSGNHIGHDVTIGDHCYITSHVAIAGFANVKPYCFLGVNTSIRDAITVETETLVGAGSVIMKDTIQKGVYLSAQSVLFDKRSDEIVI